MAKKNLKVLLSHGHFRTYTQHRFVAGSGTEDYATWDSESLVDEEQDELEGIKSSA